jgi:2-polyprenyl-6-methoxyphenol hydroxylase-like FAD-dependent oxidoreductase
MKMSGMKALIVGGGTAGMCTALTLIRKGVSVDLIDKDPAWGVNGAGITITGPTLRALKEIGVLDEVIKDAYVGNGIKVCDVQGRFLYDLDTPMPADAGVAGCGGITRPGLHKILSAKIRERGTNVRLGVTVDAFEEESNGTKVTFSDGTVQFYNLVVGSDGLFSRVRELIFPDAPKPEYTGQSSWRVTVDTPAGIDRRHYFLGGPLKVGFTPVSATQMYMFVLETAPKAFREANALHTALAQLLADYGGPVAQIRDSLNAQSDINFRPLEGFILPEPWHKGHVIIIGDAAHPTTPQLASGAGMAVEDAIVLAEELECANDVLTAFAAFMRRRIDRCRLVTNSSVEIGRLEQRRAPIAEMTAIVQRALAELAKPI